MEIIELDYQTKAIDEMIKATQESYEFNPEKKTGLYFISSTGSGKTVMVSKYSNNIFSLDGNISIVFISPKRGDLLDQSFKKFRDFFPNMNCTMFHNSMNIIEKNQILFIPWEKIKSEDNIWMKPSERNSIPDIIQKTHVDGRYIILIIDESHFANQTDLAIDFKKLLGSNLTIEMTATPKENILEYDRTIKVEVNIQDVIDTGMIRSGFFINKDLHEDENNPMRLLKSGLQKQKELQNKPEIENRFTPIIFIQIPDGDDQIKEEIEEYLIEENMVEGIDFFIWLASYKTEGVADVDFSNPPNTLKIVISKQALSLGWDCPSAQIWVRFRDTKSEILDRQSCGRINRQKEKRHYDDIDLNYGYIYTDSPVKFQGEGIIPEDTEELKFKEDSEIYKIQIPSLKITRTGGSRNRINKIDFTIKLEGQFAEEFKLTHRTHTVDGLYCELNEKYKLDENKEDVRHEIVANRKIENIDVPKMSGNDTAINLFNDQNIEKEFKKKIRDDISCLEHGFDEVNKAASILEEWFDQYLDLEPLPAQKIFLNVPIFSQIVAITAEKYLKDIKEAKKIEVEDCYWPNKINLNAGKEYVAKKYYNPAFAKAFAKTPCNINFEKYYTSETEFVNYLTTKNVKEWLKQGTKADSDFWLKYQDENGDDSKFFPDFFVIIGEKIKYLTGGICVYHGNKWRINRNPDYDGDFENWEYLDSVIEQNQDTLFIIDTKSTAGPSHFDAPLKAKALYEYVNNEENIPKYEHNNQRS